MPQKPANLGPIRIPKAKPTDYPATRGMLDRTRQELKAEIKGVKAEIKGVKAEIKGVRSELNAKIDGVRSELKAEIASLRASVERTNLLVEEQNANNRIVLEGLQALWQRQDRLEAAQMRN